MKQKTVVPEMQNRKRSWQLVDARGKVLGRLASEVAQLLIGKGKVDYMPNFDMGDGVVVVNAKEVVLTGKKEEQKKYRRHSGYPGGLKEMVAKEMRGKFPERIIELAVKGMLPDNRLKKLRMARLKVFVGAEQT